MAFITANEDVYKYLNGVRVKVKKDFAEIDFWLSEVDDEKVLEFYRQWIINVTTLDNDTPLEVIHFHTEWYVYIQVAIFLLSSASFILKTMKRQTTIHNPSYIKKINSANSNIHIFKFIFMAANHKQRVQT